MHERLDQQIHFPLLETPGIESSLATNTQLKKKVTGMEKHDKKGVHPDYQLLKDGSFIDALKAL